MTYLYIWKTKIANESKKIKFARHTGKRLDDN